MTPPDPSATAPGPAAGSAGSSRLRAVPRITERADFLLAARAARQGTPAFLLQARDRGDAGPPRAGFTCSRKVGNAVARNRAKRRLREAARLVLPQAARPGWDYVLIGRAEVTAARDFDRLMSDLHWALSRIHGG